MELTSPWSLRKSLNLPTFFFTSYSSYKFHKPLSPIHYPYTYPYLPVTNKPCLALQAKGKKSKPDPILKPSIVQEVSMEDEEDGIFFDEFDDDDLLLEDDGEFEDDYLEEEDPEPSFGDGEGGGGVSLAGTSWDKEVLEIAEEVALSFEGDLGLYAFKTLLNSTIRVRVEKLSTKSGSPGMDDIEAFSIAYRKRLDEAELAGSIPQNISLEVSSPGVERLVQIPQDLDRFKDRSMYVKYLSDIADTGGSTEKDGIFKLVSFNLETKTCTWGVADVRVNREKAGKGRPLSKKQREWRLETPFEMLRLVKLCSGN